MTYTLSLSTVETIRGIKADPSRKSIAVFNLDAVETAYMKEGGAVSSSNGIPIYARGNVSLNTLEDGKVSVQGPWSLVASGACVVVVFEGFD